MMLFSLHWMFSLLNQSQAGWPCCMYAVILCGVNSLRAREQVHLTLGWDGGEGFGRGVMENRRWSYRDWMKGRSLDTVLYIDWCR